MPMQTCINQNNASRLWMKNAHGHWVCLATFSALNWDSTEVRAHNAAITAVPVMTSACCRKRNAIWHDFTVMLATASTLIKVRQSQKKWNLSAVSAISFLSCSQTSGCVYRCESWHGMCPCAYNRDHDTNHDEDGRICTEKVRGTPVSRRDKRHQDTWCW